MFESIQRVSVRFADIASQRWHYWEKFSSPVGRQRRWGTNKKLLSVDGASCRFHEKNYFGANFVPSLRDGGPLFNANPGLRCACPGLFSLSPSGRMGAGCFIHRGRRSRWTTVTKLCDSPVQNHNRLGLPESNGYPVKRVGN